MRRWLSDHNNLVTFLVAICVMIVAFVVIVGGLIALINPDVYSFSQYIGDLGKIGKVLFAAAIVIGAKVIGPMIHVGDDNVETPVADAIIDRTRDRVVGTSSTEGVVSSPPGDAAV